MKKLLALILSLVMLLTLAACGLSLPVPAVSGDTGTAAEQQAPFTFSAPTHPVVGTWELSQRTKGGADWPYDGHVLLTLEEGGTGFVSDDGAEEEVSWSENTLSIYGRTVSFTIVGDTLRFTSEDAAFVFTRLSREPYARQGGTPAMMMEDDPSLPTAPDFALKDRDGKVWHLSDFYGKPVIINFWATWCGPCQSELPYFNDAYLQYGDQIQFLMVDLVDGSYETEEGASAFVDGKGYEFPLFFDYAGEGMAAYEVSAIPFTVIISPYGRIVDSHLGAMSAEELQALIDQLL